MDDKRYTLRLGSIRGVSIDIHFSWLVITALVLLSFWGQLESEHSSLGGGELLLLSAIGAALFFVSVLVHELAHALMALRRGIEVKSITLFLFGGATEADASSKSAGDEFVVAIVGPLTNFAIAAFLAVGAWAAGPQDEPIPDLLISLATINILLAVFNLAPGLPLDGGRVFRSIIWGISGDLVKATRWATAAGVGIGYLLLSSGLLWIWQGNPGGLWLAVIGWFISQSAKRAGQDEGLRSVFQDLVAADIMSSPVVTIPAETSIADVVREYFAKYELTAFPVVEGSTIHGLVSVSTVRKTPEVELWKTTAGEIASQIAPALIATRRTPMLEVIAALSAGPEAKSRALVVEDGLILGIISPSDIIRRHQIADLIGPALTETFRH